MIFVLALLGVLIAIFRKLQFRAKNGWQAKNLAEEVFFPELLLPGFLIGIFQMSNFWDFPIYLTVTLFTLLCAGIRHYGFTLKMLKTAALRFILVIGLSLVFAFPFNQTFEKIATGIRLARDHSLPYQLMVLWGYQLVIAAIFFFFILWTEQNHIWKRAKGKERERIRKELTFMTRIRNVLERFTIEDVFTVILFISAIGLVLIPELVYVEDIYSGEHKRANTMFKLTYQAFIMFGLACGYVFVRIWQWANKGKQYAAVLTLTIFMVILPMIYPFKYAIPSWYKKMDPAQYEGLDGLAFLQREYPDDYALVEWLRENIKGQPNILEANGDSYTYYGRISMATGLPTVQGWYVHEWLWRDNVTLVQGRVDEVKKIYESEDLNQTVELLKKYQVQYIVIGKLEHEKFPELKENKLLSLGTVVFERPTIQLIQLR
jgi:YYY domain-containing protein